MIEYKCNYVIRVNWDCLRTVDAQRKLDRSRNIPIYGTKCNGSIRKEITSLDIHSTKICACNLCLRIDSNCEITW